MPQAGALLNEWMETGVLARDEEAGIFIYEEEFDANGGHYVFDGIVCLVKLEPFEKRVVLRTRRRSKRPRRTASI